MKILIFTQWYPITFDIANWPNVSSTRLMIIKKFSGNCNGVWKINVLLN